MKKLLILTIILLASLTLYGQNEHKYVIYAYGGLKIGSEANIASMAEVDSVKVSGGELLYYVGATPYYAGATSPSGAFQPLEATLTDIADGTIAENLVNTAYPWADDEVASSGTWNTMLQDSVVIFANDTGPMLDPYVLDSEVVDITSTIEGIQDSLLMATTMLRDSLFHSRIATDSDSIDATDKGGKIYMNHADTDTLTLRTNATVPFPIETEITVINWGAGQTTIEAEGGVNIYSANGALNLRVQYSAATLIKQATDTWLLVGDIE